ncbi:MAG: hypothetical protein ACRDTF_23300 [Pseudonocardiaceae bacterium]
MSERRLRDLYAQLDAVEDAVELRELLVDLQEEVNDCRDLIGRSGSPDDLRELADLESRARDAIRDQDSVTATAQLDRARQFFVELMRRSGHWDRTVFSFFHEERHKLVPAAEADSLFWEGEQAIVRQDWAALAGVNARLRLLRELVDCPSLQDPLSRAARG